MVKIKPPSKTIIIIARDFGPVSAAGRMMQDVVRVLLKEGHKVHVLARKFAPRLTADPNLNMARVRFRFPGAFTAQNAVRKVKADMVLSCADQQVVFSVAAKISSVKNIPHISFIWNFDSNLKIIHAQNIQTRFIVSGRCMAARLIKGGFEAKQISVVPPWLDRAYFRTDQNAEEQQKPKIEKEIRKDETPKFRILFFGPENAQTPYQSLIDLATMLAGTNPEIEFLFVGESKAHEKIAQLRAARTLDNIRLVPVPPPAKFKALMQLGDVHVVTLTQAACGQFLPFGLFAAIAAERPVVFIGPAESEAAILVRDFKCGEVVLPSQPGMFLDVLMLYRHNADAWYAASKAATHAVKSFSPEQSLKAIMQRIYESFV